MDNFLTKLSLACLLLTSCWAEDGKDYSIFTDKRFHQEDDFLYGTFPEGFKWNLATSSYQIEGAWDEDGKGENIWDNFTHSVPSPIFDESTGDVACDSYHKIERDVELLKDMGVHSYRFSLSWARILPKGTIAGGINEAGIAYYNKLINRLLENGIEPMVTLYHWDLPQTLMDFGGWTSEQVIPHFEDFARLAYQRFGNRVKQWITINEPWVVCVLGYGFGVHAPGHKDEKYETYQCIHNIIKSHAKAYRVYEAEFKPYQQGRVGITLDIGWNEPKNASNYDDILASERALMFKHGIFGFPIYYGKYPDEVREYVDRKSIDQGEPRSRLPEFDADWKAIVQGSTDFLGLNHYTSSITELRQGDGSNPGYNDDQDVATSADPAWPESASDWLKEVPWGFRKLLVWLKQRYNNPEIIVTENGWSDTDAVGLEDEGRVRYFTGYINNMLKAINLDGVNVTGYTGWSLMDNFEWARGYSERFGIHWVNFTDPERPRTPKNSAMFLKKIFADNGFVQPPPTTTTTTITTTIGPTTTRLPPEDDPEFLWEQFPPSFKFALATASYQIEGGWDADGKGPNIWDNFTHSVPSPIFDGSTGDVACDSYHKYQRDVEMLKDIGVHSYRFSLSWSRMLPNGTLAGGINELGVSYYNKLINLLLQNNIEPVVTLYHWDLPQALQDKFGGWPSEELIPHFEDFARLAYSRYGDRVKSWITINEPWVVCVQGYGIAQNAPGIRDDAIQTYQCGHTIIKSHARAYRIYEEEFKPYQKGRVGVTLDSGWYEPKDANNYDDVLAAERALMFKQGWFGFPVFYGKYPDVMREFVDRKSVQEGLNQSRLPEFDEYWRNQLRGSLDFLGLNHYTTALTTTSVGTEPGYNEDQDVATSRDPSWPESASSWLQDVPWGFRKLLVWLKETYNDPEIWVTENGFSDNDQVGTEDDGRVRYFTGYINNLLRAIKLDGVNVTCYTGWSLMDNFEWSRGYSERFGIHWVNFTDPERPRIPKKSAAYLKKLFADHGFVRDPATTTTTSVSSTSTTTMTTTTPSTTTTTTTTTTPQTTTLASRGSDIFVSSIVQFCCLLICLLGVAKWSL